MSKGKTLIYPIEYRWLRAHGFRGLTPWLFIDDSAALKKLSYELYAETGCVGVPFARKQDRDDVAFFFVEDDTIPGRVLTAHLCWTGKRDEFVESNVQEFSDVWSWLSDEAFPETKSWASEEALTDLQGEPGHFSDIFVADYERVSGRGSILELKLRILADKTPNLERFAHMQKLEDVENAIIEDFASVLDDEEKARLRTCRQLRNKILHCDFKVARDKLDILGREPRSGGTLRIDLDTGDTIRVSDTRRTRDAGVFAWLLESANSGDFAIAFEEFTKAAALIDRLIVWADERENE